MMEEDTLSADDELHHATWTNKDESTDINFTLYSGQVDDGFLDTDVEIYLKIEHNCVKDVGFSLPSRERVREASAL
ncbi:hypothetical protein OESDEN_23519 [Oesophagostomum dentatum]|uniref:Uncharacterized protein n=1 Tax=Oesophagostomum dentatum TaxID=61180 RepID=A0A0B1RYY2_OESDE|nr:hypothetical protein OESDEN_23519 [Oesophagostomum dentatum]